MIDSKQLYQEVILDHNRKPRNWGLPPEATHQAEGVNPLCGDHIHVALKLAGDLLEAVGFEGESCAICKASASMMTTAVKGKPRADSERLVQEFRDMATGKLDTAQPHHLGRLTVFAGVRDLPTRVKCAILPWHAAVAAVEGKSEPVSTESEE